MRRPLRIANCSGFLGDRLAAAREMVEGGPIDFLTGDYLAELTMLILWKARSRDPEAGYARTFLAQMRDVLRIVADRGIRVVANAGGLNPAALAARLRELARELDVELRVAHLEGDDLLPRLEELRARGVTLAHAESGRRLTEAGLEPITANAYLGAWGIVRALEGGADVVICPRVTDASLVVGPAAWHFGWSRTDWDRLAGAVVAGHVIECGAQATGGNYPFFREIPGLEHPGFPIAEVAEDGSAVITKHPGTGGRVSIGTVTAQLLYEIDEPRYRNPDVVARFDSIRLSEEAPDRVRIAGVRGEPPPGELKVCVNALGGYRNSTTIVLTGLDIEEKAALVVRSLEAALGGASSFETFDVQLVRTEREDAASNEQATARLRITVRDRDPKKVGRRFSAAAVELALSSIPGFFGTAPPAGEAPYGIYWPALVPRELVEEVVVTDAGERERVPPTPAASGAAARPAPAPRSPGTAPPGGPTRRLPIGTLVGARSGDKGGNANVGVWVRRDEEYPWLEAWLTVDRFRELVPESAGLEVRRYELPNLRALNFVVVGLLGEGVAASLRFDPQAKGLGEYLRSRHADLPVALLEGAG